MWFEGSLLDLWLMSLRCSQPLIKLLLTCSWPGFNLLHICLMPYVLSFELREAAECFIHQLCQMLASPVRWRCCISITPPTTWSLGSMTSVAALFYDPLGVQERSFPHPVLTHCLSSKTPVFWWEAKIRREDKHVLRRMGVRSSSSREIRCSVQDASHVCARSQGGWRWCGCKDGKGMRGGRILGKIFFVLPREPTMVSWNNAVDESLSKENKALTSWVLKAHSWANTLLL